MEKNIFFFHCDFGEWRIMNCFEVEARFTRLQKLTTTKIKNRRKKSHKIQKIDFNRRQCLCWAMRNKRGTHCTQENESQKKCRTTNGRKHSQHTRAVRRKRLKRIEGWKRKTQCYRGEKSKSILNKCLPWMGFIGYNLAHRPHQYYAWNHRCCDAKRSIQY